MEKKVETLAVVKSDLNAKVKKIKVNVQFYNKYILRIFYILKIQFHQNSMFTIFFVIM